MPSVFYPPGCSVQEIEKFGGKMTDLSQYTLPNETPVAVLDCQEAFNGLTDQEKLYAHYLAQASFAGGLIVLVQVRILSILEKIYLSHTSLKLLSVIHL